MRFEKMKSLEAAGWKVGDAADFLQLSGAERQLLDARVESALANAERQPGDDDGLSSQSPAG